MFDNIPMSAEGFARLKKEIEHLENDELPPIIERLAAARAEGDLKENAEYHDAREAQARVKGKIDDLKGRLSCAQIIDPGDMKKDEIRFGATFQAKLAKNGTIREYTLVGYGDEDVDSGRIYCKTPLANVFLGKKVGDVVQFKGRKNVDVYEVVSITYGNY